MKCDSATRLGSLSHGKPCPDGSPPTPQHRLPYTSPQANLVCSCLAGEGELKRTFLSSRKTIERLDTQRQLLQQLSTAQQPGCTIM